MSMTTTPASSYHPSNPQPDLRTASMSDLQHERNHPFESRRAAARAEIQRRGTHKVTVEVEVAAEDFADGWAGKSGELAESIKATLFELQGDNGMDYRPIVVTVRRRRLDADVIGRAEVAAIDALTGVVRAAARSLSAPR